MFLKFVSRNYEVGDWWVRIESPRCIKPQIECLNDSEIQDLLRYISRVEVFDINRYRSLLIVLVAYTT